MINSKPPVSQLSAMHEQLIFPHLMQAMLANERSGIAVEQGRMQSV